MLSVYVFEVLFTQVQKPRAIKSPPIRHSSFSFYDCKAIRASGDVHNTMTEPRSSS
jgi:hypothetical protein